MTLPCTFYMIFADMGEPYGRAVMGDYQTETDEVQRLYDDTLARYGNAQVYRFDTLGDTGGTFIDVTQMFAGAT